MGYRIDIDHDNCLNCARLHGRLPRRGARHDPAGWSGRRGCRSRRAPALDDGAPRPGRRMHRLRDLHPGVPDGRHDAGDDHRPDAARATPGSHHPPAGRRRRLGAALGDHRRGAQAEPPIAVGRPVRVADGRATEAVAGLANDGRGRSAVAAGALPGCLPGRHGRRPLRRPRRRGSLRRRLRRRGGGQPLPVGLWLDLHGTLRGGLPARRPRRADRDPDHQAVRGRARPPAARRAPRPASRRARGDHRRRAGRHVGRLLPGPPRLPGHRLRGDARARAA